MEQIKRLPIEDFIFKFKEPFDKEVLIEVFTQGNCYHFSVILSDIYPNGRIVYNFTQGHFIFEYEGEYYDITGKLDKKKIQQDKIEYFDSLIFEDYLEYLHILRDCVLKADYQPYK